MLTSSLKFAARSLGKYKMYTVVNLLGLTLGITAALLLMLYVQDELSFDRYHDQSDQIYQLVAEREIPGLGVRRSTALPAPLAGQIGEQVPALQNFFRMVTLGRADLSYENNGHYEVVAAVEPEIFQILDFDFIQGDPESALANPNAIILTQSTAEKYFGDEDPMGRLLTGTRGENIVTAVIEDQPANTHLQFNVLFPFPPYLPMFLPNWPSNWDISAFTTYLQLQAGTDIPQLEQQLTALIRATPMEAAESYSLSLLALPDIHLHSNAIDGQWNASPGSIETVWTLQAIAVFLVLIACINYTSLATARSANRAHEISIRKMHGAQPGELMLQFLAEALLLTLLATLLALSLAQMLLPVANAFSGKSLTLMTLLQPTILLMFVAGIGLVGLGAGAYPAFVLSHQNIISGLADQQESTRASGLLRKLLVLVQFGLSVILLFSTLVVMRQMTFIQSMSLGFDQSNVIIVDINSQPARVNAEAIRNEFLQNPEVLAVSNSSRLPGDWKPISEFSANVQGRDVEQAISSRYIAADAMFLDTFDINLVEGLNLLDEVPENSVLINQAMAQRLSLDSPIGAQLTIDGNFQAEDINSDVTVIGIVEDFHYQSLHQAIQPLIIGKSSAGFEPIDYYSIKVSGNNLNETIAALRTIMQHHDPVTPFEYNILEARIDGFYSSDRLTGLLFSVAAAMAIFIACMGLFGLSSYATEQRSKEVGIRKVLGASVTGIVRLLSADFMKPVLLAIVIALPVGYYLMAQWLQNFAYYINIGAGIFLLSALLAIGVSLATVSIQSVRAALRNPVESIAYE
ncbi:MAG: ABC transporter permease [Pseudohongiellaceae bacterium]